MTDEEINSDAARTLVRHARNEEMINCLLGRLSNVSRAFVSLIDATRTSQARGELSRAREALERYDLQEDIVKLQAALLEREGLEVQMKHHGFSHMIRRRAQEE